MVSGPGVLPVGESRPHRVFDFRPESWRVVPTPAVWCFPPPKQAMPGCHPAAWGEGLVHSHQQIPWSQDHFCTLHKDFSWRIISTLLQIHNFPFPILQTTVFWGLLPNFYAFRLIVCQLVINSDECTALMQGVNARSSFFPSWDQAFPPAP